MGQEERELIGKLKAGDPSAYHRLVDDYANRLFGLARALVGNPQDAEEIVQETLSGVFRGIGSFRQQSSLWTWLARITARQALKFRNSTRRRQQMIRLADDVPTDPPRDETGAAAATGVDVKLDVAAAIARLSDDHRQIIVLREIEQMSYTEISQALDMPLGTVESRLARARNELRTLLADWK